VSEIRVCGKKNEKTDCGGDKSGQGEEENQERDGLNAIDSKKWVEAPRGAL